MPGDREEEGGHANRAEGGIKWIEVFFSLSLSLSYGEKSRASKTVLVAGTK